MNGVPLAARDQRALLLGATIITTVVAVARGFPAWRTWRASTRTAALDMAARAAQTNAVLTDFSGSLDSLEARTDRFVKAGPGLIAGETPAEAAATLAAMVAEAARLSSVRLDAVEVAVDTSRTRELPRVSVTAQATADVTGLATLLRILERGPTVLAVSRLAVRPTNPTDESTSVETLAIRITVEGLVLVRTQGTTP